MNSTSSTERRLFLGIPAPEGILGPVAQLQAHNAALKGIRWIPKSNLHITVFFFGNVAQEMLPNLLSLIHLALSEAQPFTLRFERFCFAPKTRSPRMIWARYEKQEVYRLLVEKVGALYEQIQPKQQTRKSPVPHITVARLKDFSEQAHTYFDVPVQEKDLPVEKLVLWESELKPSGAEYSVVGRFELGRK